jgi:hypothetical protein
MEICVVTPGPEEESPGAFEYWARSSLATQTEYFGLGEEIDCFD